MAATGALVVAALVAGSAGGWVAAGARDDQDTTTTTTATAASSVQLSGDTMDAAAIVKALQSSVVSVETQVVTQQGPFSSEGTGAGTGIVLDDDGNILTNAHVVEDAQSVTVTLAGETEARTAEVVGVDTDEDVAVLHVDDTDGLVPAELATDSDDAVQVGDDVVAIGNALALEGGMTVTEGIVSATDREISDWSVTLDGLIQTDAAISSGNSGGPLVNAEGEVVGMNTAVAASGGGVEASNIGFVIPIGTAVSVANQLLGTAT